MADAARGPFRLGAVEGATPGKWIGTWRERMPHVALELVPLTVADAIAIAASGVGVVIVPMSLAHLHHRKDAAHRPLADGPTSSIALAWPAAPATASDAASGAFVETFIGIVRGRTANSSR